MRRILGGSLIAAVIIGPLVYFSVCAIPTTAPGRPFEGPPLREAPATPEPELEVSEMPIPFPERPERPEIKRGEELGIAMREEKIPQNIKQEFQARREILQRKDIQPLATVAEELPEDKTQTLNRVFANREGKVKSIKKAVDGTREELLVMNEIDIDFGPENVQNNNEADGVARNALQNYLQSVEGGENFAVLKDTRNIDRVQKPEQLVLQEIKENAGKWYVTFRQFHQGLPVFDGSVKMIFTNQKKLITVTDNIKSNLPEPTEFRAGRALVSEKAKELFEWDDQYDTIEFIDKGYFGQKPAYKVDIEAHNPLGQWEIFVDGIDAQVRDIKTNIRQQDAPTPNPAIEEGATPQPITTEAATEEPEIEILETFFSRVLGKIYPKTPADTQTVEPMANEYVYISGQQQQTTDEEGYFENPQQQWYSLFLDGPYVTVHDDSATTNVEIINENPEDPFTWDENSASLASINSFYHVNKMHEYFANNHNFNLDKNIPLTVNSELVAAYLNGCGAWFNNDLKTIEMGTGGTQSCPEELNYALSSDVVYHEYSHFVIEEITHLPNIYGAESAALGEGLADYFAATINNDPVYGDVVSPNRTRNLDNTLQYDLDMNGQSHHDGQIFSGALWDLRQEIGAEATDRLVFNTLYQDRLHFETFMYGMIIEDDDNDDFSDGTPNLIAIIQAFDNHGIGPGVENFDGLPVTPEEWSQILEEQYPEGEEDPIRGGWSGTGCSWSSGVGSNLTVTSGGTCTVTGVGNTAGSVTVQDNAYFEVGDYYFLTGGTAGQLTTSGSITIQSGGTMTIYYEDDPLIYTDSWVDVSGNITVNGDGVFNIGQQTSQSKFTSATGYLYLNSNSGEAVFNLNRGEATFEGGVYMYYGDTATINMGIDSNTTLHARFINTSWGGGKILNQGTINLDLSTTSDRYLELVPSSELDNQGTLKLDGQRGSTSSAMFQINGLLTNTGTINLNDVDGNEWGEVGGTLDNDSNFYCDGDLNVYGSIDNSYRLWVGTSTDPGNLTFYDGADLTNSAPSTTNALQVFGNTFLYDNSVWTNTGIAFLRKRLELNRNSTTTDPHVTNSGSIRLENQTGGAENDMFIYNSAYVESSAGRINISDELRVGESVGAYNPYFSHTGGDTDVGGDVNINSGQVIANTGGDFDIGGDVNMEGYETGGTIYYGDMLIYLGTVSISGNVYLNGYGYLALDTSAATTISGSLEMANFYGNNNIIDNYGDLTVGQSSGTYLRMENANCQIGNAYGATLTVYDDLLMGLSTQSSAFIANYGTINVSGSSTNSVQMEGGTVISNVSSVNGPAVFDVDSGTASASDGLVYIYDAASIDNTGYAHATNPDHNANFSAHRMLIGQEDVNNDGGVFRNNTNGDFTLTYSGNFALSLFSGTFEHDADSTNLSIAGRVFLKGISGDSSLFDIDQSATTGGFQIWEYATVPIDGTSGDLTTLTVNGITQIFDEGDTGINENNGLLDIGQYGQFAASGQSIVLGTPSPLSELDPDYYTGGNIENDGTLSAGQVDMYDSSTITNGPNFTSASFSASDLHMHPKITTTSSHERDFLNYGSATILHMIVESTPGILNPTKFTNFGGATLYVNGLPQTYDLEVDGGQLENKNDGDVTVADAAAVFNGGFIRNLETFTSEYLIVGDYATSTSGGRFENGNFEAGERGVATINAESDETVEVFRHSTGNSDAEINNNYGGINVPNGKIIMRGYGGSAGEQALMLNANVDLNKISAYRVAMYQHSEIENHEVFTVTDSFQMSGATGRKQFFNHDGADFDAPSFSMYADSRFFNYSGADFDNSIATGIFTDNSSQFWNNSTVTTPLLWVGTAVGPAPGGQFNNDAGGTVDITGDATNDSEVYEGEFNQNNGAGTVTVSDILKISGATASASQGIFTQNGGSGKVTVAPEVIIEQNGLYTLNGPVTDPGLETPALTVSGNSTYDGKMQIDGSKVYVTSPSTTVIDDGGVLENNTGTKPDNPGFEDDGLVTVNAGGSIISDADSYFQFNGALTVTGADATAELDDDADITGNLTIESGGEVYLGLSGGTNVGETTVTGNLDMNAGSLLENNSIFNVQGEGYMGDSPTTSVSFYNYENDDGVNSSSATFDNSVSTQKAGILTTTLLDIDTDFTITDNSFVYLDENTDAADDYCQTIVGSGGAGNMSIEYDSFVFNDCIRSTGGLAELKVQDYTYQYGYLELNSYMETGYMIVGNSAQPTEEAYVTHKQVENNTPDSNEDPTIVFFLKVLNDMVTNGNGHIDVSSKVWIPGACTPPCGGSYGGAGQQSAAINSGAIYGEMDEVNNLYGRSARISSDSAVSWAGGKITVQVLGDLIHNGKIKADGGDLNYNGTGNQGFGSSGGSVNLYIHGGMSGTGEVTANGGDSNTTSPDANSHGGGGGRIYIAYGDYIDFHNNYTGSITAFGGKNNRSTTSRGGTGTIALESIDPWENLLHSPDTATPDDSELGVTLIIDGTDDNSNYPVDVDLDGNNATVDAGDATITSEDPLFLDSLQVDRYAGFYIQRGLDYYFDQCLEINTNGGTVHFELPSYINYNVNHGVDTELENCIATPDPPGTLHINNSLEGSSAGLEGERDDTVPHIADFTPDVSALHIEGTSYRDETTISSDDVTQYQLQIDEYIGTLWLNDTTNMLCNLDNQSFASPLSPNNRVDIEIPLTGCGENLAIDTPYYWRIRYMQDPTPGSPSSGDEHWGLWSLTNTFEIDSGGTIIVGNCSNGTKTIGLGNTPGGASTNYIELPTDNFDEEYCEIEIESTDEIAVYAKKDQTLTRSGGTETFADMEATDNDLDGLNTGDASAVNELAFYLDNITGGLNVNVDPDNGSSFNANWHQLRTDLAGLGTKILNELAAVPSGTFEFWLGAYAIEGTAAGTYTDGGTGATFTLTDNNP